METRKIKLYRATTEVDVLFVCPEGDDPPNRVAADYLAQEIDANGLMSKKFKVEEITDIRQVPKSWMGANVWGSEDAGLTEDLTPEMFFNRSEDEVVLLEIERHQKAINELKKRLVASAS